GRARRVGAAAPAPCPLSGGAGSAAFGRYPGRLSRRRHLRGTCRPHERAARYDEELDPARAVETQDVSRGMSVDDTIDPADGDKLLAAEYVLGVLGAAERREVERRLAQEPALASEVAFWEERLTGLTDAVAPVSPPEAALSRIETAIAAAPRPASVWQSLTFWRGFAIASATLAAASIAALVYIGLVPGARVPLLATLSGSAGQPNFAPPCPPGGAPRAVGRAGL